VVKYAQASRGHVASPEEQACVGDQRRWSRLRLARLFPRRRHGGRSDSGSSGMSEGGWRISAASFASSRGLRPEALF